MFFLQFMLHVSYFILGPPSFAHPATSILDTALDQPALSLVKAEGFGSQMFGTPCLSSRKSHLDPPDLHTFHASNVGTRHGASLHT